MFFFGASIGSFLGVVFYRIPRKISVVHPPSQCESCNRKLMWYELVPVLSFLFLGMKCKKCGVKISPFSFFLEILSGLLTVAIFYVVVIV